MGLTRWALCALLASASPAIAASECWIDGTPEERQFHSNEAAAFIGLHHEGRVYFIVTQNPETKAWAIWATDPDDPPDSPEGDELDLGKLCMVYSGMDSLIIEMPDQ